MNRTHSYGNGTGYGNETLLQNPGLCTLQTCDLSLASFLYLPTIAGNTLYAAFFGVYIILQLLLLLKKRTWGYTTAMVLGLVLELVGYIGRVLLHDSPFDNNYFLIYLICLTIAPAFMTAAIYLCLSRIVIVYGEHLSSFKPRTYTLVFCSCDILSLVLQAVGGGIAATATTNTDSSAASDSETGKDIMLAGLGFQVFSLLLFGLAAGEFALRVMQSKNHRNPQFAQLTSSKLFRSFLVGLLVASVTIFARSVYRCVELSGGFSGSLFVSDQALFMVMEGVMIIIATSCLTFLHPAICFRDAWDAASFHFRQKNDQGALPEEYYRSDKDVSSILA